MVPNRISRPERMRARRAGISTFNRAGGGGGGGGGGGDGGTTATYTLNLYDTNGSKLDSLSGDDDTRDTGDIRFNTGYQGGGGYYDYIRINGSTIIDDFEDGDISEYTGDKGEYSVKQDTVWSGSYALHCNPSSSFSQITSGSGLNDYPERGDTITWYVYAASSGSDRALVFQWARDPNGTDFYSGGFSSNGELQWDSPNNRLQGKSHPQDGRWYKFEAKFGVS